MVLLGVAASLAVKGLATKDLLRMPLLVYSVKPNCVFNALSDSGTGCVQQDTALEKGRGFRKRERPHQADFQGLFTSGQHESSKPEGA
jgi:hypothetical protein